MTTSGINLSAEIDPSTLGPGAIGEGIRITWPGAVNGRVAIVQGVLASVTHHEAGTDLVVDIGVNEMVLTARDLVGSEVEQV